MTIPMESIPFNLLNIIAKFDVAYVDHRPVTLCILTGVSKRLNASIDDAGTRQHSDLVDYYMITNSGSYQSPVDVCGMVYKLIPVPKIIVTPYCSSRGVDWYLPRKKSSYHKYTPMLTHAAIRDCCLSVFKAILFRISKSRGWQLTPQFMRAIIHNHRIDILRYIGEKYQKFPDVHNLHECILVCELDITMFIASLPRPVVYKLTDLPNGMRHLTVSAYNFAIKRNVITYMIKHYELLNLGMRYRFTRIIKILIDNEYINDRLIRYAARLAYRIFDDVDLFAVLIDNYRGHSFTIPYKFTNHNCNNYLTRALEPIDEP